MGSKNNTETMSLVAIGEKLKSAREKKGLTIDQAQRQTHIHSTVLVAIENGRSAEILTPTYVKSFLKKYSSYLGLDSNQLVKEYQALHPDLDSSSLNIGVDSVALKSRIDIAGYMRILGKAFLIAGCIFLLVITVRGAGRFIKTFHKPSALKTDVRAPAPRAIPAIKPQKKTVDKAQSFQVSIPDNEPITLMMKVKEDVFVGVKRDGVLLFRRPIPKGTVDTFTAEGKLNVSIAKARSVELVLNGRPLAVVGKGAIKDLEITRKGIKVK